MGDETADDEGKPETEDTGSRSEDRLWHRFGTDEGRSATGDGKPAAEDAGAAAGETGQTGEETPTEGNTDRRDQDRLWDSQSSDGADQRPETSDGNVPDDGRRTAGGRSADAAADGRAGRRKRPSSDAGTSFDHLLERSAGTSDASQSESLGTDLEAFFGDLDEFDRATSGSQVLVVSPRAHSITDEVCSHFLTSGGVSGRNVMFVTTVQSPDERLRICRDNAEWTGGKVAVVELGDVGSGSSATGDIETVGGNPVLHKRVNSPKNLSKTGLLITQTLKEWSSSTQPTVLCFHTLTAVSGYVQTQILFQFLFTLQAKLDSFGVTGHYHMDSNKHDEQELNTLKTLFDLVIDVSPDGEIQVE